MSDVGVLDAGVILAVLDDRHPAHGKVRALLARGRQEGRSLHLSSVNLAEALQHGRPITQASGLDLVALLEAFDVTVHRPDVAVARVVASLARLPRASLADRFAAATAVVLGGRLHTTDRALAKAVRGSGVKLSITVY